MTRYRALNDWTATRASAVIDDDGAMVAEIMTKHCTLEDTRDGSRWAEGCWKVTVKSTAAATLPGMPRSKTFKGETAWMDAQRYHHDTVLALRHKVGAW